ncbi:hypothetical protein [Granulicatella balaenopterae]|uniref:hypothetical protein n=1 Tax=Granulicatella balaenopterae TaxID=137733 RepID=UPI0015A58835|nr:hypothetical protein [Granulicatella balaenopterae]
MNVDQSANKEYYQSQQSLPCDCNPCQNYCQSIKEQYPNFFRLLANWQIDAKNLLK